MKCCVIGCDSKAKYGIYSDKEPYTETYVCADHVEEYAMDGDKVYPINIGGDSE